MLKYFICKTTQNVQYISNQSVVLQANNSIRPLCHWRIAFPALSITMARFILKSFLMQFVCSVCAECTHHKHSASFINFHTFAYIDIPTYTIYMCAFFCFVFVFIYFAYLNFDWEHGSKPIRSLWCFNVSKIVDYGKYNPSRSSVVLEYLFAEKADIEWNKRISVHLHELPSSLFIQSKS